MLEQSTRISQGGNNGSSKWPDGTDLTIPTESPSFIFGHSPEMERALDIFRKHALFDTTFLLRGESGVGKECLARFLHRISDRSHAPFMAINCAAIPESLIEGELFGNAEGAYTGAKKNRRGLFELADGGTVLLDEIDKSTPSFQAKMLRVIEHKSIRPLGGSGEKKLDVRLIFATNADLEKLMSEERFSRDLYWRIGGREITLPPLRDRKDEIPALIMHFLEVFRHRYNRPLPSVSPDALKFLISYPWPGNVRQLESRMHVLAVECENSVITLEQVQDLLGEHFHETRTVIEERAEFERQRICQAIVATKNDAEAAKLLKIELRTLKSIKSRLHISSRLIRRRRKTI